MHAWLWGLTKQTNNKHSLAAQHLTQTPCTCLQRVARSTVPSLAAANANSMHVFATRSALNCAQPGGSHVTHVQLRTNRSSRRGRSPRLDGGAADLQVRQLRGAVVGWRAQRLGGRGLKLSYLQRQRGRLHRPRRLGLWLAWGGPAATHFSGVASAPPAAPRAAGAPWGA